MNVLEVVRWVDSLVLQKTGQHLNNLQLAVVAGVWQSQKYREIADRCCCTRSKVKRVASYLWQLVSDELGETVNKRNFQAAMERYYISNFSSYELFRESNNIEANVKVEICNFDSGRTESRKVERGEREDLREAPELASLCDRANELSTLKQWILAENSRLVSLFGLPGIGKTALARELVEEIKGEFERVVWRSSSQFPTLDSLERNLVEFLCPEPASQPSFVDCLRSERCLIILDDFQETFASGELVGTYLPDYRDCDKLLKKIGSSSHKSCFLLLSWEQPTAIATLEAEGRFCRALRLRGLGKAEEILTARELTDRELWPKLIDLYSGNPFWLKIIASAIQDLFAGSVATFLSCPNLFLGDLEPILQAHYERLSEPEKLVILWLAEQDGPANIATAAGFSSNSDFLIAVQSLRKRGLIEKATEPRACHFTLEPVIREFVKKQ